MWKATAKQRKRSVFCPYQKYIEDEGETIKLGKMHLSHTNIELLLIKKTMGNRDGESKIEKMDVRKEELSITRIIANNFCDWR